MKIKDTEITFKTAIDGLKVNASGTKVLRPDGKWAKFVWLKSNRKNRVAQVSYNKKTHYVSRLVAIAFLPPPRVDQRYVIHKDGDSSNDHYANLAWANGKEMHLNQVMNGQFKVRNYQKDKRLNSKIPDDAIPYVLKWIKQGVTNKYIAKMFNTSDMSVSRIRKRYMKQTEEETVVTTS